ncbi:hypothetical protein JZ751_022094 [Albula glossodonta]|uniref:Uncharacterized protein n=1 Tax=Albula glossodonta TaxID=121402 RepID=A0A8T2N2I8_9TELE|nr:hypothetical protein JZ751_022094 [Albula glossodonta]
MGTTPLISRASGSEGERVRTEESPSWLSGETSCHQQGIGDVGGMKTLQKRWTSFLKAGLVCEDGASGERYNVLRDVFTLQPGDTQSTRFYACITRSLKAEGFESSLSLPDAVLNFMRDHHLMENSLAAAPLLVRRGITYTKIAEQLIVSSSLSLAGVLAEGCRMYPSCEACALVQRHGCMEPKAERRQWACEWEKGRCWAEAEVQVLQVRAGLRLLLPCVQVSPFPCTWTHPPGRHTRQQHWDLAVIVTRETVGSYICQCEEDGAKEGRVQCRRAAYELVLEDPSAGGNWGPGQARRSLGLYLACLFLGILLGAFLMVILRKHRPAHQPILQEEGPGTTQNPALWEEGPGTTQNPALWEEGPGSTQNPAQWEEEPGTTQKTPLWEEGPGNAELGPVQGI